MLLRGCFVAAKKVAIALNTLIRTEFPRDHLSVIGFAYYAREIRPESLAELSWHGYEYGTNLQHGLMLARRILAREHGGNREIVVITDGEPTAHFENGQVEFSYPPTRRTIQETLREVVRCTKDGITINTFMLERSRALAEFVALITRLNRGRAFYATPERLGEYVLVDFVAEACVVAMAVAEPGDLVATVGPTRSSRHMRRPSSGRLGIPSDCGRIGARSATGESRVGGPPAVPIGFNGRLATLTCGHPSPEWVAALSTSRVSCPLAACRRFSSSRRSTSPPWRRMTGRAASARRDPALLLRRVLDSDVGMFGYDEVEPGARDSHWRFTVRLVRRRSDSHRMRCRSCRHKSGPAVHCRVRPRPVDIAARRAGGSPRAAAEAWRRLRNLRHEHRANDNIDQMLGWKTTLRTARHSPEYPRGWASIPVADRLRETQDARLLQLSPQRMNRRYRVRTDAVFPSPRVGSPSRRLQPSLVRLGLSSSLRRSHVRVRPALVSSRRGRCDRSRPRN